MRLYMVVLCAALTVGAAWLQAQAPTMPTTAGETLSGKKIVLADAVRGHAACWWRGSAMMAAWHAATG